jgi:hypothetical protein
MHRRQGPLDISGIERVVCPYEEITLCLHTRKSSSDTARLQRHAHLALSLSEGEGNMLGEGSW